MKYAGKNIYFRDIYLFIDRVKQFLPIKKLNIIRKNL